MKIEIEVPDGFLFGKLVFTEARGNRVYLSSVDVNIELEQRVETIKAMKKAGCRIPWEAN